MLPLLEPSSILLPPTTTDLINRHQAQTTQETVWVHNNRFLSHRQLNAISNIHSVNRPLSPEEKRRKRNTTFPSKSERNKKDEIHLLLLNHPPPPPLLPLPPLSLPNPHFRNSPSSRNFCTSHPTHPFSFPPPSKIPSILTFPPYLLEPPLPLPPPSRPIPVLRHHLRAWTKRR